MTISVSPETEALLREKARRDGKDVSAVAEAVLAEALAWEAQEYAETIQAVRSADLAAAHGQEWPFSEFVREQRAKHGFNSDWPHPPANANADAV